MAGGVPSDLFAHIYSFLLRQNLSKSAKAFRKECEVPLQAHEGPGLLEFYDCYRY